MSTQDESQAGALLDLMKRFTGNVMDLTRLAEQWSATGDQRFARANELGPTARGLEAASEAGIYRQCAEELRNAIKQIGVAR